MPGIQARATTAGLSPSSPQSFSLALKTVAVTAHESLRGLAGPPVHRSVFQSSLGRLRRSADLLIGGFAVLRLAMGDGARAVGTTSPFTRIRGR